MNPTPDQLTAYALGEGTPAEREAIAAYLAIDPAAAAEVAAISDTAALLTAGLANETATPGLDPARRAALAALPTVATKPAKRLRFPHQVLWPGLLAAGLAVVIMQRSETTSRSLPESDQALPGALAEATEKKKEVAAAPFASTAPAVALRDERNATAGAVGAASNGIARESRTLTGADKSSRREDRATLDQPMAAPASPPAAASVAAPRVAAAPAVAKPGAKADAKSVPETRRERTAAAQAPVVVTITESEQLNERGPVGGAFGIGAGAGAPAPERKPAETLAKSQHENAGFVDGDAGKAADLVAEPTATGEAYHAFAAEGWHRVGTSSDDPNRLSTLGADVDTASYANVRRFLSYGQLPPADAVRTEELLNSFHYDYQPPADRRVPFAVLPEVGAAPWAPDHRVVRIGLKGYELDRATRPPANLVFLIDVSGSMNEPTKLPLVQRALSLLTAQLRADDRVAIVTYAGAAGVRLEPTSVEDTARIQAAIDGLSAGGSTNGAGGIRIAYEVAKRGFIRGGVNRVILCTDGDFNVGVSSRDDLERLITDEARSNVFLTALGFGMGNYHDTTMQVLADKGNGQYAYIDSEAEARRQIVDGGTGMLVTIAKDVKLQVEFNPALVGAWRLLGYEKRHLEHQDFADDRKDGGEIGAGHTMTALYEIVMTHRPGPLPALRYAAEPTAANTTPAEGALAKTNGELLTVSLRWKLPEGATSSLIAVPVSDRLGSEPSSDFRFATAVAEFAEALRASDGAWSLDRALAGAQATAGDDAQRREFVDLVRKAQQLKR